MNKFLTAAAAAAMIFGASTGFAQNAQTEMYMTGSGDEMRVMGADDNEGSLVIQSENYAVPADCPEGSYYMSAENQVTACGEGGASFDLAEPESGATMSSGDAFPEGAMVMTPRESGEQKQ